MANGNPRLEVEIGAVTADLKRGLSEARNELRKFQKEVGNRNYKTAIDEERLAQAQSRTEAVKYRTEIAKLSLEKRKNQQAVTAAAGSYREAQQRLTALGRSIREAQGGFTNTTPAIRSQITEYRNLNNELKRFDAQLGNHQRNVGNYGNTLNALGYLSPQITSLLGQGGLFVGSALAARDAYQNVARFDGELKNVQKTTGLTSSEIEALGRRFVSLSKDLQVVSSTELAQYATVAGQLGIKGAENILNFSEALAKLETASDISGEQGASDIARLLTLTDGGVQNIRRFTDEIVNLGNNFPATEAEILANATRIAQSTGVYRLGRESVLAYATATKSVGVEAELVGSSIGRTLGVLEGLSRSTGKAQLVTDLFGISQDELARRFKENSSQVLTDFVASLNRVDKAGGSVNEVLESIGITAIRDKTVLGSLATNGYDVLTRSINTTREALGAADEEFALASTKIEKQVGRIKIAWDNLILSIENGTGAIGNVSVAFADVTASILDGLSNIVSSNSWKEFFARLGELSGNRALGASYRAVGNAIRLAEDNPNASPKTKLERAISRSVGDFGQVSSEEQALRLRQQREVVEKRSQEYKEKSDKENFDRLVLQNSVLAEMNKIYYSNAAAVAKTVESTEEDNQKKLEAIRLQNEIKRLTDSITKDSLSEYDRKLFDINKKYDEIFSKIKDEGLLGLARENKEAEKMKLNLERLAHLGKLLPTSMAPVRLSGSLTPAPATLTPSTSTTTTAKFSDEISKEMRKGISRGIGRAFTDLYNNIDDLGSNFYQVFSNVFQKLSGYVGNIMSDVIGRYLGEKLGDKIDSGDFSIGNLGSKTSQAIILGAQMAGKVLGGMINRESAVGQGAAGALSGIASGAATGVAIGGKSGGIWGAAIGGVIGLLGGIFGSKDAKRQRELQEQQLAEQRKQTALMERQAMLTYSASVVGQQVNGGVVTAVERDAFGNLVAKINGKDIELVLERTRNGRA